MGLDGTIAERDEVSWQEKLKPMIFLRHHIHESLKA